MLPAACHRDISMKTSKDNTVWQTENRISERNLMEQQGFWWQPVCGTVKLIPKSCQIIAVVLSAHSLFTSIFIIYMTKEILVSVVLSEDDLWPLYPGHSFAQQQWAAAASVADRHHRRLRLPPPHLHSLPGEEGLVWRAQQVRAPPLHHIRYFKLFLHHTHLIVFAWAS